MYCDILKKAVDKKLRHAFDTLPQPFLDSVRAFFPQNSAAFYKMDRLRRAPASQGNLWTQIEEVFLQECRQLEAEGVFLYLEYLLERFALSEFERHCVRMLYAFEMDADYGDIAALVQDGWGFFTPYLARLTYPGQLGEEELYGAFAQNSLLGRFFLEDTPDGQAACMRALRLNKRILEFAWGNLSAGADYGALLRHWDHARPIKPWIGKRDARIGSWLERRQQGQSAGILYVYGEAGSGRRFSILHACRRKGLSCCIVDLDGCCREMDAMDLLHRRRWLDGLLREMMFFDEIPVLTVKKEGEEAVRHILEQSEFLFQEIEELFPAAFICAVPKAVPKGLKLAGAVYKKPLTLLEGRTYWETEGRNYPLAEGLDLGSMSNKFELTPGKISAVLENAEKSRIQEQEDCLTMERVTQECYALMHQQMGRKAVKVRTVYTMDDLILPKRQKSQLLDAVHQIKYKHKIYEEWGFQEKTAYGRGVTMVFAGPPGTGKTMAAQVIAGQLGMQLYKVNLSCVVSKYIGETEKNLEEIFDQAQKSRVILLFDEADALFGKRSEGKESMDRYSNMEAAFLLQKMEGYEGAAILATNLFHHFDEAFKRRIKIIVEFPLPGEAERRKLWKSMIPERLPAGEIDFDYLAAQFELTGSSIRNILLHSAFLAAAKGKAVDMEEIIPAVKNEYAKNGKKLSRSDVSEYCMYL